MATKTISITEYAYERLAALKKGNESFSEMIERITLKPKLSDFYGVLSKESADKLEKSIKELRKEHTKSHERRVEHIRKELIAKKDNETLLTRNKKHFEKIKGLKIESY